MAKAAYSLRDSFQRGDGTGATRRAEDTPNFIEESLLLHRNETYGICRPAADIATVNNPAYETVQTNEAHGISIYRSTNFNQRQDGTFHSDPEEYILPISQDKVSDGRRPENETATNSVPLKPSIIQAHVNQAYGIILSAQCSIEQAQSRIVERLAQTPSQAPADSTALRLQKHIPKKAHKTKISKKVPKRRELVVVTAAAVLSVLISGASYMASCHLEGFYLGNKFCGKHN